MPASSWYAVCFAIDKLKRQTRLELQFPTVRLDDPHLTIVTILMPDEILWIYVGIEDSDDTSSVIQLLPVRMRCPHHHQPGMLLPKSFVDLQAQ